MQTITKVLDGPMQLRDGWIIPESMTVVPGELAWFTFDFKAGIVTWANEVHERGPYTFTYEVQEPSDRLWAAVRETRNQLLTACDWTQLADADLTTEQKQLWLDYRNLLRTIPQRYATPVEIVWPVPPSLVKIQQALIDEEIGVIYD